MPTTNNTHAHRGQQSVPLSRRGTGRGWTRFRFAAYITIAQQHHKSKMADSGGVPPKMYNCQPYKMRFGKTGHIIGT